MKSECCLEDVVMERVVGLCFLPCKAVFPLQAYVTDSVRYVVRILSHKLLVPYCITVTPNRQLVSALIEHCG